MKAKALLTAATIAAQVFLICVVMAAPPMRRVFTSVVGVGKKLERVRLGPLLLVEIPGPRGLARGVVLNTSWPSRKNNRLSGKNTSNAVRLTTTLSDSTAPKSGFSVAVSCRLVDGRQKMSVPTR